MCRFARDDNEQEKSELGETVKVIQRTGLWLIFAACVLWGGLSAAQQITATLRGQVLDPSGAAVRGASVTVTQLETGFTRTGQTDAEGGFTLVELPVGDYKLEAEAKGFQKYVQEGLTLHVNQTARVNVKLVVGTETQTVEVHSNASMIEPTSTTLGTTVGDREVLDLPLNGRHFTQLGILQVGVTPITPGLQLAGGTLREGQAYAVNGQRPESNEFLIDGADNFNGVDGGFVLEPPVDAISEFKIQTHTANAEFGHSSGSTTNIVTKSGTNDFHGSAWEFFRNNALDAKSFFADSVEPLRQNQFGGTFGGPIKKDRTFFFLYYEGFRNSQGATARTTVPSLQERTGNFGDLCTSGFDTNGICQDSNPNHQLINEFSGEPIPYNQLPFINPISQNLLPYYPEPNQGQFGYVATLMGNANNDQFGVRVDQYVSAHDQMQFRYSFSQGDLLSPVSTAGANVPGFPVGQNQRSQNFVAQETHTFSPTLVGIARFSFLRNKLLFNEHLNGTDPASLGFEYQPTLEEAIGPPFIQVGGYASIGDPITGPRNTYQNSWDFSGSLTWIKGRHEFKFGGGYQYDQINVTQGIATNGFFVFSTFPVNNSMASFLFGQPVFFLQGGGDFTRGLRGQSWDLFAQDTFKVTRELTINYGLRYDVPSPYTEVKNRQNLWIPGRQSVVFPTAPEGLLYPGDPGVPGGLIPTQRTGFAPRVGLAWDIKGDGRWLVTSAYGIFYDPYYTGVGGPLQTPISAPPYLQTPQIQLPNFADPYNGENPFNGQFAQPMTLLTLNPNLRLPYAQDWNLTLQRAFGKDWLTSVGYIGTKGTKLPRFIEGNPAVYDPNLTPTENANFTDQRRLYSGCTVEDPTAPCAYSSAGEIAGISNSTYNALQASLQKRFSHGVSFLASYTYSKTLDDVSTFNITGSASQSTAGENDLAQDPFNLAAEHGRSMFDARHRFVISYQWNLPWYSHPDNWYGHILGNWMVNGITTFMSNTPFTVYDSTDVSLQGSAPEISGFPANRPNLVGNPNSGPHTPNQWFNLSAFQQLDPNTQAGQFGSAGRNVVNGPAYQQWDFSAIKMIPIKETMNLQFRAEFFNIFNNVNFLLPDNDISSPTFGAIKAARPGRIIQFALKFAF